MVISLEVRHFLDLEAFDHGLKIFSFRLWTRAQFKRADGWTPVLPALLDTGAPFSVLPKTLWADIDVEAGFATHLRGVVPLRSAVLNARMVQVTCLVSDLKTTAPPLKFWALLADGEVPLVLGCSGFLDRIKCVLDIPRHLAWLEF